jgi:hypothetical protein
VISKSGIAGLCGLLIGAGVPCVAASTEVGVRLYNYAGVPSQTLESAKAEASAILGQAGVEVQWAECRIREDEAGKDPACSMPLTPTDLEIRLLDQRMTKGIPTTRHCLGYALLAPGANSIAGVFFHRAIDLEKSNLAIRSAILGAMMAHEVGHLLLEQAGHSNTGIMRARWGDDDLKQIARGRLWFTAEQARRITVTISRRRARSLGGTPIC